MSYTLPQVLLYQEYRQSPAELADVMRAHLTGPNAMLHRYSVEAERSLIAVGPYSRSVTSRYAYPGRTAGGIVDRPSVKVLVENALLRYFHDLIGEAGGDRGTVAPVSGHTNWVRSSKTVFRASGDNSRTTLLYDRDVQIGDIVHLRGVVDDEDCPEVHVWSTVEGFAAEQETATILPAVRDANNAATINEASATVEQTDGPDNCVSASVSGSAYSGLASGNLTETYTVEVIRSSISGCNAARLRVLSASGTDDQDEITPGDFGEAFAIGTRGLTMTLSLTAGPACSDSAEVDEVDPNELVVGQTWEIVVRQAFERACLEGAGDYTGPSDTYIIAVTKGGVWADLPEVTVTTTKGLDASAGAVTVTGTGVSFPAGSYGLTAMFTDCFGMNSSSASVGGDSFGGDDALAGLRLGDKFYVTVVSGTNGPIQTLILRDDIPTALQDATDLDLELFIAQTIEVTANRLSQPPLTNYTLEDTQVVLAAGMTAYHDSWTLNGVPQPLQVWDGFSDSQSGTDYGEIYIEYREWLPTLVGTLGFSDGVDSLDDIPGPLDELNPLKWGLYLAHQNANTARIGYTAVADPDDLDSWQEALERVQGQSGIYHLVPLSSDREVQGLFHAAVSADSSPEIGLWKGVFVSLTMPTTKMIVGQSDADTQALQPTSTDGRLVLATLADNPGASGTQYTLLRVPGGNAGFITHGVRAGDTVRFLYTVDVFGAATYAEFTVDAVLTENTLRLLAGHTSAVSVAQKIEIWRTLSKDEQVTALVDQAGSFTDRRVVAVFPDVVGTAGNAQDGMFLAAAVAGRASGLAPHRSLTRTPIVGFDDVASRTTDYFSRAQLDRLAEGGITLVVEDASGSVFVRHSLTTDMSDSKTRSESFRRNVDSVSSLLVARLEPFIGTSNVTPSLLDRLRYEVEEAIAYLGQDRFGSLLGPQMISGGVALDSDGVPLLRQHPLLSNRVEIVIDGLFPEVTDNIEVRLLA